MCVVWLKGWVIDWYGAAAVSKEVSHSVASARIWRGMSGKGGALFVLQATLPWRGVAGGARAQPPDVYLSCTVCSVLSGSLVRGRAGTTHCARSPCRCLAVLCVWPRRHRARVHRRVRLACWAARLCVLVHWQKAALVLGVSDGIQSGNASSYARVWWWEGRERQQYCWRMLVGSILEALVNCWWGRWIFKFALINKHPPDV